MLTDTHPHAARGGAGCYFTFAAALFPLVAFLPQLELQRHLSSWSLRRKQRESKHYMDAIQSVSFVSRATRIAVVYPKQPDLKFYEKKKGVLRYILRMLESFTHVGYD